MRWMQPYVASLVLLPACGADEATHRRGRKALSTTHTSSETSTMSDTTKEEAPTDPYGTRRQDRRRLALAG